MESKYKIYKDTLFNNNFSFLISTILMLISGTAIIAISYFLKLFNSKKGILVNDKIISFGIILSIIAGFIILIALLNILIFAIKRQKRLFYLYDDRISTKYKKEIESDIFFKDIFEVYRFRTITNKLKIPFGITDCLAYRKDKEEPWIVVLPVLRCGFRKNKGGELIEKIVEGYVRERLIKDFYNLKNGKVLNFEYLVSDNKNRRDLFDSTLHKLAYKPLKEHLRLENSKIYCKANIHKIILEATALIYNDQKVFFDNTDRIEMRKTDVDMVDFPDVKDFQVGNIIEIIDKFGNVKLSVNTTCLMNGDLFVALIKKIFSDGIKPVEIPENQAAPAEQNNEIENTAFPDVTTEQNIDETPETPPSKPNEIDEIIAKFTSDSEDTDM